MIDTQDSDNSLASEGTELTKEEMKELMPRLTLNGEVVLTFRLFLEMYLCYHLYKILRMTFIFGSPRTMLLNLEYAYEPPGHLVQMQIVRFRSGVEPGRLCISNELPNAANATGPGTALCLSRA